MSGAQPPVGIFSGVRVIELAQFVFVPAAGALLADWGADVVKIEHPVSGDGYRALVSQGIIRVSSTGVNQNMEMHNRGKRSIGVDVASSEGRDLVLKLVESADVFLTNFLPSALRKWRLDVDDLRAVNPKLIYARGHGHGLREPCGWPTFESSGSPGCIYICAQGRLGAAGVPALGEGCGACAACRLLHHSVATYSP